MTKQFCRLLAAAALLFGPGAVNASPLQEIFFYGPEARVNNPAGFSSPTPPRSSIFPSLRVELPTLDSQLCISPCVPGLGFYPSPYNPGLHQAGWVPGSFQPGPANWTPWPPQGSGSVKFDPLVFTAELFSDGSDDKKPVEVTIIGEQPYPLPPPGNNGQSVIGQPFTAQFITGEQTPTGVFNQATYCQGEGVEDSACVQGAAVNTPVPLPSTLLLMGIGVLGLGWRRRGRA